MNKSFRHLGKLNQEDELVDPNKDKYERYVKAKTNPRNWDMKHRKLLSKPPKTCELCGYPMNYKGHILTTWEQKWSIHEVCRDKAANMLDRETGIARERKRKK